MTVWPAGGALPPQAAERYWTGLLLEGTMVLRTSEGVPPDVMHAPSFLMIPAGAAHSVRCSSRGECALLTFQAGPHNRRTFGALPQGPAVAPDGLPAYSHQLGEVTWEKATEGVWKGVFENAHWARLSVGANDASLWKIAPAVYVEGCVGKRSDERVGVVLAGTLNLRSADSNVTAGERSYYAVPGALSCTCRSSVECVVLAH